MKRSLLGVSEATRFDKAYALIGGFAFAPVVAYISFMMISDLPNRSELIVLQSSNVVDVEFLAPSGLLSSVRFKDRNGLRLTVRSEDDGFEELVHAIQTGQPYKIYYNRERELFSRSPKLYSVVYEIHAGDNVVNSYDERMKSIRTGFGAIGVFGLLWMVVAILVLRAPTKKSPSSPLFK